MATQEPKLLIPRLFVFPSGQSHTYVSEQLDTEEQDNIFLCTHIFLILWYCNFFF